MEKPRRRRADAQNMQTVPVRLVINYVGVTLLISLIASAYLLITGREAVVLLSVTGSCITGLLALLGRTNPQEEPGPSGAPSDPVNIAAPPDAPVNVTETPAPTDATEPPPISDDLKQSRPVPGAQFIPKEPNDDI